MPDRLAIGVRCSVGVGPQRGGRVLNEDNYLICQDRRARWREGDHEGEKVAEATGALVAVADGMGGHARGDLASAAAVRALAALPEAERPADPTTTLRNFLLDAHARLAGQAPAQGATNMGTTLTVGWILEGQLHWVHVGDSRLYLQRGEGLVLLTRDHTRGEFARRDSRPLPRDPGALAQGFVFGSRGLGDDRSLRIDAGVDTGTLRLAAGDRLLFSSDGLHAFVEEPRLNQLLREAWDAGVAAVALAEAAMASGSDDNVTALVVRVDEVADPPLSIPLDDVVTLVPEEG